MIEEAADIVRGRALRALDVLGSRKGLLDNWKHQLLPEWAATELDRSWSEGRPPAPDALEAQRRLRSEPNYAGLLFWGSGVPTLAIVASHADKQREAAELLKNEIESLGSSKPQYAAHLKRVATMLGLALR